jgi:hypothetical protein
MSLREVYCPRTSHSPGWISWGIDSDGTAEISSRAPTSNYDEGWVQVGNKNSCVQYSLVEPGDDDEWQQWGMVMKRRMIRLMNCYRLRKIIRSSSNTMAQAMRLGGHPFQQGTSPHHNPSVYRQPLLTAQNLQSQYLQQFERLLPHIANTTRTKCPPDQRMNDDLGRNYIMRGRHVIQFITLLEQGAKILC